MKRTSWIAAVATSLVGCSPASQPDTESSEAASKVAADTVYTNGKIYTVNEAQPWAEAFAIKDGEFLAVGSAEDVSNMISDATEVVDLGGSLVLPGLVDPHHHLLNVSDSNANLAIQNPDDADAMLAEIKAYAEANPDLEIIRGEPWNLAVFPGDSPSKELLDEIIPDRPAYFLSQSGHSAWVNSKTFELAGITRDTEQTSKIIFDTDEETGELTGTVREFGQAEVLKALPRTDPPTMVNAIGDVSRTFSAGGFTTFKLAEGRPHHVKAARLAEEQGVLNQRLVVCWEWQSHYSSYSDEEMLAAIEGWHSYQSDMIDPRCVKIFADGGPDSFTSFLYDDYEGRPDFKGQTHRSQEELQELVEQFTEQGLGVMIHAFGDATAGQVIDIYRDVRQTHAPDGPVLHLSHSAMATEEDLARLAEVEDVGVDFSPMLNYRHPVTEFTFVPPIGNDRYNQLFRARSAIEAGLVVGFGSDYPSMLDPRLANGFVQMQTWITRVDPFKQEQEPLNPEQSVTLEQAVHGFTMGSASLLGYNWADQIGSIESGKLADFIVVDRNIFEIPVENLHETRVTKTVVHGKVVFE